MAPRSSRRVTLPGAAELFRSTSAPPAAETVPGVTVPRPSGRQRHDEKITVYVSSGELLALEQARLNLRARYGVSCDRGRIVREAVAALLADFKSNGDTSLLVRRLTGN